MSYIDPNSPRSCGEDSYGNPVSLGDMDSDGIFVGYIDDGGLSWESRREHDEAITAGNFIDAWNRWNRCGGLVGVEPTPEGFAEKIAAPENYLFALQAAEEALKEYMPGGFLREGAIRVRAEIARWN